MLYIIYQRRIIAEVQQGDAIKASYSNPSILPPEQTGSNGWRALDRGPYREGADLSTTRAALFHPTRIALLLCHFTSS